MSIEFLSPEAARKLAISSQRIVSPQRHGRALQATLNTIQHLSYIQIDTISVIQRAHHHTLWNRNPRYRLDHLEKLLADKQIFEYWSHAAAYLPMQDYRFYLPRMQLEAKSQGHWHQKDPQLMHEVLARIRAEGPLLARDFVDPNPGKKAMWVWKPAKYALEQLFMEGKIMAKGRQGFNKIYDLTERVLPANLDMRMPTAEALAGFLIHNYLRAHGIARIQEFTHLRPDLRNAVEKTVHHLLETGEIIQVKVKQSGNAPWLLLPETLALLDHPLARAKVRFLSPFDNLVIQRKRIRDLFSFDYQLECYLPAAKRKVGYFVLPVLWQGHLVARIDCKAHRELGILQVRQFQTEPRIPARNRLGPALAKELQNFANFNNCHQINIDHCGDQPLKKELLAALN